MIDVQLYNKLSGFQLPFFHSSVMCFMRTMFHSLKVEPLPISHNTLSGTKVFWASSQQQYMGLQARKELGTIKYYWFQFFCWICLHSSITRYLWGGRCDSQRPYSIIPACLSSTSYPVLYEAAPHHRQSSANRTKVYGSRPRSIVTPLPCSLISFNTWKSNQRL